MLNNILILGSKGFIGSYLCDHYLTKGNNLVGADISERPADCKYDYSKISELSEGLKQLFTFQEFDICINAAGSGNVSYSVDHPLVDFEANTFDVIKILEALRIYNPKCKYLHISSAAVYGNPVKLPIQEVDQLSPISPYGYHKLLSEIICKEYFELYKIPIAIVRPFSIYGKRLSKQILWDICTKLKNSDNITLYGNGQESRDFIHINDFIRLVEIIIEKSDFNLQVFNAASGKQITVNEIATIFENVHEGIKTISFNGEVKKGDPVNWEADITTAKQLGFQNQADFKESVIEYIHWFNQEHSG